VTFPPWDSGVRAVRRPDLNVAVILDDFSRLAFGYEWAQHEVHPGDWRSVLRDRPPDLLFVESAWNGNGGAWKWQLTGSSAPRSELVELVRWCRERGIPTVFWNKEDPVHFEDFLDTARLFDHVLTTDSDRIPEYHRALGHDRVGVLTFAAQEALHNPAITRPGRQQRDIAFAGMYFAHRHPERREQLHFLLGAALDAGARMPIGLEIFSRFEGDEKYRFPPPFDARVVGSLDYPRMLSAYRAYKVFLNVNTVTTSPSMCARRIFEIVACGTPVVSTPSPAISALFDPHDLPQVTTPHDAEAVLRALVRNPMLRDRMVHRAQRVIWSGHTYRHRVQEILRLSGATGEPEPDRPQVTVLAVTRRPARLAELISTVGAQLGVDVELVVVMHGFDDSDRCRTLADQAGIWDVVALHADAAVPLGDCLNRAVAAASGRFVAKMDDDDLYGANYLLDQVHALEYADADVVGKQAHYLWVESVGATVLRYADREHRFTDFVAGPTIVARRSVASGIPFPRIAQGEDTGFLDAVVRSGGRIYSADRFNFVQQRFTNGDHTWGVSDLEVLANADLQTFGAPAAHVMF
jgi:spore maturation protein CgeB